MLIIGIMDAIEEFFNSISAPSTKFTFNAFIVSIGFLIWTIIASIFDLFSFVDWAEALTACIILFIIVLVDNGARSSLKASALQLKESASKMLFKQVDDGSDIESDEYISSEDALNETTPVTQDTVSNEQSMLVYEQQSASYEQPIQSQPVSEVQPMYPNTNQGSTSIPDNIDDMLQF